ncbi:hypothetical protein FRACYDRAFT_249387 [Fragilariopsis cylindrus CCMP1102]|uniref:ShKT domain-containing protein n=1 Tax=Fragilariopsis cylindrus CCMP1102 TaxID=635003 RepID=A0A1E7ET47_9STRA|nr:hypothetical protein FRACYDRAFT_249387 [Fragilariopsis cylindrus CCMP1102]|eukprot:OEU09042.1 hypothetical protein FRACYDRAFT_249387 [Fragilariopsis cylindrus CCMP1102]
MKNISFTFALSLLMLMLITLQSEAKRSETKPTSTLWQSASNNNLLRALQEAMPSTAPTFQERGECENSLIFCFKDDDTKTCDNFVAEKPVKRCITCKDKCKDTFTTSTAERGPCEDSDSFQFKGNSKMTCDGWVAKKRVNRRCKKKLWYWRKEI